MRDARLRSLEYVKLKYSSRGSAAPSARDSDKLPVRLASSCQCADRQSRGLEREETTLEREECRPTSSCSTRPSRDAVSRRSLDAVSRRSLDAVSREGRAEHELVGVRVLAMHPARPRPGQSLEFGVISSLANYLLQQGQFWPGAVRKHFRKEYAPVLATSGRSFRRDGPRACGARSAHPR
jgi:hypothetical protein